jgi:hypothetical protein
MELPNEFGATVTSIVHDHESVNHFSNTQSNFTNTLYRPLNFEDQTFEVGLSEITFGKGIFNVYRPHNNITITFEGNKYVITIPENFYTKELDLLKEIDKQLAQNGIKDYIRFDIPFKKLNTIRIWQAINSIIEFSPKLSLMLGLSSAWINAASKEITTFGDRSIDLISGIPNRIYVHSNLPKYQLVSETSFQLLRILNLTKIKTELYNAGRSEGGKLAMPTGLHQISFTKPLMLPLIANYYDSITISLTEEAEDFIPFMSNWGIYTTAILLFKRVKEKKMFS